MSDVKAQNQSSFLSLLSICLVFGCVDFEYFELAADYCAVDWLCAKVS
jgi:hypothetical protein